jgi:hypothetical protein
MIEVAMSASIDVSLEFLRRDIDRQHPLQIDRKIGQEFRNTVGEVQIDAQQGTFGSLEDEAVLTEPPDPDLSPRNSEGFNLFHQAHLVILSRVLLVGKSLPIVFKARIGIPQIFLALHSVLQASPL